MTVTLAPPSLLDLATAEELEEYEFCLRLIWEPEPYQVMPDLADHSWDVWALIGGRGIGKTDTGSHALDETLRSHPGWRARIIAPTLDDAKEACIDGPTGLKAHNPRLEVNYNDHIVRWPNGSRARWFGLDKPNSADRLRAGGNAHIDWFEEIAAATYAVDGWIQADLGRRLGKRHPAIVTTTPKNVAIIRWLLGRQTPEDRSLGLDPQVRIAVSHATTDDNPHLDAERRRKFYVSYGGTRMGIQELEGKLLEDIPGALWTRLMLDACRGDLPQRHGFDRKGNAFVASPDVTRVVVAVDPATTSGEDSDETGIVVAAKGADGRGYVLADRSCKLSPDGWARRAVQAFEEFSADRVVAESNQGGQMVEHVLRTVAPHLPISLVHAQVGKRLRAEPVAALYEQGRVTHVEPLPVLEAQMTGWTPDSGQSPDRLDALVHALTDLMLGAEAPRLRFRGAA